MLIRGLICDGPKCDKGPKGSRVEVCWDEDAIKTNPEKMPDAFYRFNNWQPIYEESKQGRQEQPQVRQFCSTGCVRDYIRDVVPPLSPREQLSIAENNKQVEAKKAAKAEPVKVPLIPVNEWPDKVVDEEPVSENLVPMPDGFPE